MTTAVARIPKSPWGRRTSFVPLLFGLVGLAIFLSSYQNQEMLQVVWNSLESILVDDNALSIPQLVGGTSTSSSTRATALQLRNGHNHSVEKSSEDSSPFDLIFWSDEPILTMGVKSSSLVVTRTEPGTNMDEVIQVDFRICNDNTTTCPVLPLPERVKPGHLELLRPFQLNKGKKLTIYSTTGDNPRGMIQLRLLRNITFWSENLQLHVPVEHLLDSITLATCGDKRKVCPKPCPQNKPNMVFPYLRDIRDGLCKSSHPRAIPPQRPYGGSCHCERTCHTPEAGDPYSTWPWKNESEREFFLPGWNNQKEIENKQRQMLQYRHKRRNNPEWSSYKPRFGCSKKDLPKKTPLPIVGAYLHHLYYIPEAKLIFCGIPKVGVTEWIKFFRYAFGAKDYLSLPHYKKDREQFLMNRLQLSRAEELWNDPSWTKAVFIRNPLERLLSAYMDKIVGLGYTQKVFKIGSMSVPKSQRPIMTFEEFVDRIVDMSDVSNCTNPNGLSSCTDPHWGPQMMMCGLDYLLPKFDFLGNFDHISEHTKMLLERVGMWEKHGRTFDDGSQSNYKGGTCDVPPPKRDANATILGFNQRGPSRSGRSIHATGSQSRFDELYTPELIAKVRKAYALDFAVWDEMSGKDVKDVAKGRELKVVREYCGD